MSFRPKPWYFEKDCPVCTRSASSFCRNPIYFFAHAMWVKSREGHGKNWMHFVYKLDNLFRSIRVSDENSSVTPAIQYFKNLVQVRTFLRSDAEFKSKSSTFNPSLLNLLFLMHLLICFELNGPEIEKHYKWTMKSLKLGMVSSFHPHGMCKKVDRVTTKTGCTSCTNWTLSFEVSGFRTKTHLLHLLFNILIT